MDIEAILRSLNSWGRYQVVLMISVNIYGTILAAIHLMSFIYIMDTPLHFCKPYEGFNMSEAIPISKTYNNEITEYESCSIYKLENGTLMNETTSCPNGNEYLLSEGESTVVNELGLVCENMLMANTAMSVYFCGVLLGSLICGLTSDYLGRRNVFLTASILLGITGIGLTFTESYFTFCVVWFLTAIEEQILGKHV
ncbi:organic cation transporter protein-like [Anneissia japonica]|uniref:organic cation transporter protein-like n=1 Tax=Anneissia japonica TaxID=1529436 RepID=UPI0014257CA6|nr:organic cation transporter protein-like [Anneissia japonica]